MDIHHLKGIKVPALCFNSLFEMLMIAEASAPSVKANMRFNSLFEMHAVLEGRGRATPMYICFNSLFEMRCVVYRD